MHYLIPVETLIESPYMNESGKELVKLYNEDPARQRFYLVFECDKKKDIKSQFEDGYYDFLFNVKHEWLHGALEQMFEELQNMARPYNFRKCIKFGCAVPQPEAPFLGVDRQNEYGNYYLQ